MEQRRTRQNLDMSAVGPEIFANDPNHIHKLEATLEATIKRLSAPGIDTMTQDDPMWAPAPFEKLDNIKDEKLREAWKAADKEENDGLLKRGCVVEYLLDDLPPNTKIIGSMTTRKVKRSGKMKSRTVSRGDQMIEGLHYTRTHSPTIMQPSMRALVAMGCSLGLKFKGGDYTQAFANADLPEDEHFYMYPPPSARQHDEQNRRVIWKVLKGLYGGKSSSRNWFLFFKDRMTEKSFTQCPVEPCVFTRKTERGIIIIGLYVDDLIILYSDDEEVREFTDQIQAEFDFTVQETLTDMCGIEVDDQPGHVTLTLKEMITSMAERMLTPEELQTIAYVPASDILPKLVDAAAESKSTPDPKMHATYRKIVGELLYVDTTVRPDVSYAVGMLSRVQNYPNDALLVEAKHVLRYLYHTRSLGLRYMRNQKFEFYGMVDSDWGTRCSTSAYVFMLASAAISYLSKKQPTIAMSSTEAEIYAASLGGLEAVFLRWLFAHILGSELLLPTDLYVDNKGAIDLANDYLSNSRVRHFSRRHLKIRELVQESIVAVKPIKTANNLSDIFTKPIGKKRFEKQPRPRA